jgi:chromosomal replication initiation ATPase DnaA
LVEAAVRHGISIKRICGKDRLWRAVDARCQVAGALNDRGYSLAQIGAVLGNRHHTTVLYYLRRLAGKHQKWNR